MIQLNIPAFHSEASPLCIKTNRPTGPCVCLVAHYRTMHVQTSRALRVVCKHGHWPVAGRLLHISILGRSVLGLHSGSATSLARNDGNEVNIRNIGPIAAFLNINWLLPLENPTICSGRAALHPSFNHNTPHHTRTSGSIMSQAGYQYFEMKKKIRYLQRHDGKSRWKRRRVAKAS